MNKIYRLVWNRELNALVVASELAKGAAVGDVGGHRSPAARRLLSLAVAALIGGAGWAGTASAADSVYFNDGTDAGCQSILDQTGAQAVVSRSGALCQTSDKDSQTTRALFYGTGTASTSLSLGGELFVSSGNLGLGGGSTGAMRIGALSTLNASTRGLRSLAIGSHGNATVALGDDSIAIGSGASAMSGISIAIGSGARAAGMDAIALGLNSVTTLDHGIAIGTSARSNISNGIAIGTLSVSGNAAGGSNSPVAVGNLARATGAGSPVAIGDTTVAGGRNSVAIGGNPHETGTQAAADYSLALGPGAVVSASGTNGIAQGYGSNAAAANTIAQGTSASATQANAVAIGNSAQAAGANAFAAGLNSRGTGQGSIALGNGAQAIGSSSISIGVGNIVNGNNSGAFGDPSIINGANSYSIGNSNTIGTTSSNVFALGNNVYLGADAAGATTADVSGAIALGNASSVTVANGVALGANSVAATAAGVAGYDPLTKAGSTNAGATWRSTSAAVSIGNGTAATRQLTGLAAGNAATDAVNVAQLQAAQAAATGHYYSVNDGGTQGGNYNNDGAAAIGALAAGVGASATENGTAVGASSVAGGRSSVALGANARTAANDSVAIGANALIASTAANATQVSAVAIGFNSVAGNSAGITSNGVAIGGNAKAVTPGMASPVAIGWNANANGAGSQVAIGDQAVASGTNSVAIGGNPSVAGTRAAGNYALAIGPATSAGADNAVALGRNANASAADAVAIGGNATSGAVASVAGAVAIGAQAAGGATNAVAIGRGASATGNAGDVALGAGSVTSVANPTSSGTVGGITYTYAGTTPNGVVSIGTVGAERQIQNVAAGRVSATSTDGINGSQLFATQTATGNLAASVASGLGGGSAVNPNGSVRTALQVGGATYNSVNAALNAVNATADAGWNVTASGAGSTTANIGPNGTVTFNGDPNVTVTQAGSEDNGQVNVALNPNLTVTSVNAGGTTLNATGLVLANGSALSSAGLTIAGGGTVDMGGNVIRNIGAGLAGTDAVNKNQLDAINAGNAAADEAAVKYAFTDINANGIPDPGEPIDYGNVPLAGPVSTDGGMTGGTTLSNLHQGAINSTSTDAINGAQLYGTAQSVATHLGGGAAVNPDGTVSAPSYSLNGSAYSNVGAALDAVNAVATTGWNVTANGDAVSSANIGPGGQVNFSGDSNVTVSQTGAKDNGQVNVALNPNLNVTSITAGNTVLSGSGVAIGADVLLGSAGLTIAGGPSITTAGIDAGGQRITNVAVGTTPTDAVNLSQMQGAIQAAQTRYVGINSSGGGNVAGEGATGSDSVAIGRDAAAAAVNSIAIGNASNASVANSVALGAGSSTGTTVATSGGSIGGTTYAYAGAVPAGAVSIGSAGQERQLQNVAAGQVGANSTDAVNGSQLHATNQAVEAVGNRMVSIEGDLTDLQGEVTDIQGDITNLDGRVTNLENMLGTGAADVAQRVTSLESGDAGMFQVSQEGTSVAPEASGSNSVAGGKGAVASGGNSTALGNGAVASGANSTAIGQGAVASHDNSIALGQGSRTTVGAQSGYNAAYVGTSSSNGELNIGNRTISGVAPGIAPNDAANIGQLDAGVAHAINSSNAYTDARLNGLDNDMWTMTRGYRAATASAMAMAGLPQAYLPGKSMLAIGFGGYQSEAGMAVGLSGITDEGRFVYKAQASGNTARDWGVSVGAGIQW